jgi:hypothetical protein
MRQAILLKALTTEFNDAPHSPFFSVARVFSTVFHKDIMT